METQLKSTLKVLSFHQCSLQKRVMWWSLPCVFINNKPGRQWPQSTLTTCFSAYIPRGLLWGRRHPHLRDSVAWLQEVPTQNAVIRRTIQPFVALVFACSGNHAVIKRPFLRGCVIACLSAYYAVRLFVSAVMRLSARLSQLSSCPYVWLPVRPGCSLYYARLILLSCKRAISKIFSFFHCPAAQNPHLQRVDRVWRSIRVTKQLFLQLLRFLAAACITGSAPCLDTKLLNTSLTREKPICSRKS